MVRMITIVLMLGINNVNATLISYPSPVSFNAAAGIATTDDFESASFETKTDFHTSPATENGNLTHTNSAQNLEISNVNTGNYLRRSANISNELIIEFDTTIITSTNDIRSINDVINRTTLVVDPVLLSLPVGIVSSLHKNRYPIISRDNIFSLGIPLRCSYCR